MTRNKPRKPRLKRCPVTKPLGDSFRMQLHGSLSVLQRMPDADSWEALGRIFNVVRIAIDGDQRREHDVLLLDSGMRALQQVEPKIGTGLLLHDYEIEPIKIAVNTIDALIGKLDVTSLYLAMRQLDALAVAGNLKEGRDAA